MADQGLDITKETSGASDDDGPYAKWFRRIERARKLRKDWAKEYKVEQCERFFLGKQHSDGDGPRTLNHFFATLRITMTNLLFEQPKALVRPKPGKNMATNRKASVGEGLLESVMRQDDNFEDAARLALQQAFFRAGVLKVIYDPYLEPNPATGLPILAQDGDGNPIAGPDGTFLPVLDPQTNEPILEPEQIICDETYRFEWVDASSMLFPDSGPDMHKWSWIAEEITVTLEEARDDERFPIELRESFKSNAKAKKHGQEKATSSPDESSEDEDDQLFRYIEVYDIRAKRWMCLAEDQDFNEALIDDVLPEGIEDHPYAILNGFVPIEAPEPSPWPFPYVFPWLDVQEEYNIRRQQQMLGAKRSARKILYEGSTFSDDPEGGEAMKLLQSSRDMEGVRISDLARPPIILQDPPVNATIHADVPLLMSDWRIITGQTGARLSGASDADTATEAQFVERASNLRDAELQRMVQKWLRVALRKMWQLIRQTLTVQLFIKLRGMNDQEVAMFMQSVYGIPPEMIAMVPGLREHLIARFGSEKIEPISREDLQFEADIDVVPGSSRPRSLTAERAQWLEFLQIFAQAPQLAMSRLLLEETAKKYEFINPALIDELQLLAMQLVMINQAQAGRGGQNTARENSEGQGNSSATQSQASAARGVG